MSKKMQVRMRLEVRDEKTGRNDRREWREIYARFWVTIPNGIGPGEDENAVSRLVSDRLYNLIERGYVDSEPCHE